MFFHGYDNEGNKIYYDTTSNKITQRPIYDDIDLESNLASSAIQYNLLDDVLGVYGLTLEEIKYLKATMTSVNSMPNSVSVDGTGQASLLSTMAQSLKNNTDYQKAHIEIEKTKLTTMTASNDIQKKQIDMMDYNLLMSSQILSSMQDLKTAIENLNLTTGEIKVNSSVHVDTTKIEESTKVISESIEALASSATSQKAVNEKQSQKLDIELNKDIDFDGKTYNKIELDKMKSKEQLTNVKDENDTLLNDGLELVEEFMTDGFDLAVNPFNLMMNALKENFITDSKNIQVKYNLKSEVL